MHGFCGPEIGVVDDAALFVLRDGLAFHDPFDGWFSVDDVVVGFQWDFVDGDVFVVDHRGFVVDTLAGFRIFALREFHFLHVEVFVGQTQFVLHGSCPLFEDNDLVFLQVQTGGSDLGENFMAVDGFVVQVPVS